MTFKQLPSFTDWIASLDVPDNHAAMYFPVQRILRPNKWPSWTFCTNDFRFSTRMPEGLDSALHELSDVQDETLWQLVRMGVLVEKKKAKVHASVRRYEDVKLFPKEEQELFGWLTCPGVSWYAITYYHPGVTGINSEKTYTDEFLEAFGLAKVIPVTPAPSEAPRRASKKRKPTL